MKKKAIFCLLLCFVMLTPVVALAAGENQQAAENILQNSMATTFAVIHTGDTNGVMENKDGAVGFAKVAGLADQTVEDYETLLLDSGILRRPSARATRRWALTVCRASAPWQISRCCAPTG